MQAPPISCSDENKLVSPMGQGTSHLPDSQPSPGSTGSTSKSKAEGGSPSGKGFFKRKFPLWLKRKGPANSPQGLVVSRSRLCMEATQESPIQAVRKPTQREAFNLDTLEDATRQKTGPPLLRKLWCLKATNSKLKKPPLGSGASPLQRMRCGPVATLSRTADPQGESPLRWKPRAEKRGPEEVDSFAEPEKAETVHQPDASWLAKPWRTFRSTMAARAKKRSILSGSKRNPGVAGEKVISLPAESETSPATGANKPIGEQQNNAVAGEDKNPPSRPPPVVDEFSGSQEDEGADGAPQHRLDSHRWMEAISNPIPKLPVSEVNGCCEDNPILAAFSELEGIRTEVHHLPGRRKMEAGEVHTEDEGPGYWPELSEGEDLAELAENPGGQGMVMATRGWLTCERLGGPKAEVKVAASTRSDPDTQGMDPEPVVSADSPGEIKPSEERASGITPEKTSQANRLFPPAHSENCTSSNVTSHCSGTTLEEEGPSRVLEKGAEGHPTPTPVQTAALNPPGENSTSPGSPMGQQLLFLTEPHEATPWRGTTGPEDNQKRLIYVAAVEIVEAAIDAAAEHLAKKKEQEKAGLWGQAGAKTNSLAHQEEW